MKITRDNIFRLFGVFMVLTGIFGLITNFHDYLPVRVQEAFWSATVFFFDHLCPLLSLVWSSWIIYFGIRAIWKGEKADK